MNTLESALGGEILLWRDRTGPKQVLLSVLRVLKRKSTFCGLMLVSNRTLGQDGVDCVTAAAP